MRVATRRQPTQTRSMRSVVFALALLTTTPTLVHAGALAHHHERVPVWLRRGGWRRHGRDCVVLGKSEAYVEVGRAAFAGSQSAAATGCEEARSCRRLVKEFGRCRHRHGHHGGPRRRHTKAAAFCRHRHVRHAGLHRRQKSASAPHFLHCGEAELGCERSNCQRPTPCEADSICPWRTTECGAR